MRCDGKRYFYECRLGKEVAELDEWRDGAPKVGDLVLKEAALDGEDAGDDVEDVDPRAEEGEPAERHGREDGGADGGELAERARGGGLVDETLAEEEEEERGRVVERHLLVVDREDKEDAAEDVAVREHAHDRPQREAERHRVVLEVPVVDEDERRLQQQQRHRADLLAGVAAVVHERKRDGRAEVHGHVAHNRRRAHEHLRPQRLDPVALVQRHHLGDNHLCSGVHVFGVLCCATGKRERVRERGETNSLPQAQEKYAVSGG